MFGTHTIINVKYLGNQKVMTYFCDSNIFGVISKYFWHLPFWSHCRKKGPFYRKHNHAFVRNNTLDQIIGILGFIQSVKFYRVDIKRHSGKT